MSIVRDGMVWENLRVVRTKNERSIDDGRGVPERIVFALVFLFGGVFDDVGLRCFLGTCVLGQYSGAVQLLCACLALGLACLARNKFFIL